MKKICMIVQDPMVKGGIAAVVNGYRGSEIEKDFKIIYVESYKDGGRITKFFKGIFGYCHFIKVLLLDKPDLVHIHSSFGPSFYRKLPFIYIASMAKVPIINHIHGADFDVFYNKASNRKKYLIEKTYNKCSVLIALSKEWEEQLSKIVDVEKIKVLENYSIIHYDAYEERTKRACNKQVLFLGELGRRKGGYDIPNVIKKVVDRVPNAKFILCGEGNKEDEFAIKQMIVNENIETNVEFPGWVRDDEKDHRLRDSDVFFLPSYNEGMPMSILDAMGYGLPIVSTNVGGIPKIVRNGKNGQCCNPGDVEAMASVITELLIDDSKRKNASNNSMNIVIKEYSLEAHVKKLKEIYEGLL